MLETIADSHPIFSPLLKCAGEKIACCNLNSIISCILRSNLKGIGLFFPILSVNPVANIPFGVVIVAGIRIRYLSHVASM